MRITTPNEALHVACNEPLLVPYIVSKIQDEKDLMKIYDAISETAAKIDGYVNEVLKPEVSKLIDDPEEVDDVIETS